MSHKSRDPQFIEDILEAANRIREYKKGISYEKFLEETMIQDSVIRNLEVIGEATKNLSDKTRKDNPQTPWRNMSQLRDRLIHHYFGVNLEIVWEIINRELPEAIEDIRKVES